MLCASTKSPTVCVSGGWADNKIIENTYARPYRVQSPRIAGHPSVRKNREEPVINTLFGRLIALN
jgi:hypothetical protein